MELGSETSGHLRGVEGGCLKPPIRGFGAVSPQRGGLRGAAEAPLAGGPGAKRPRAKKCYFAAKMIKYFLFLAPYCVFYSYSTRTYGLPLHSMIRIACVRFMSATIVFLSLIA